MRRKHEVNNLDLWFISPEPAPLQLPPPSSLLCALAGCGFSFLSPPSYTYVQSRRTLIRSSVSSCPSVRPQRRSCSRGSICITNGNIMRGAKERERGSERALFRPLLAFPVRPKFSQSCRVLSSSPMTIYVVYAYPILERLPNLQCDTEGTKCTILMWHYFRGNELST